MGHRTGHIQTLTFFTGDIGAFARGINVTFLYYRLRCATWRMSSRLWVGRGIDAGGQDSMSGLGLYCGRAGTVMLRNSFPANSHHLKFCVPDRQTDLLRNSL